MALVDLVNYDILDLFAVADLSDTERGEILADYMEGLAGFITDHVADQMTDDDGEAMMKLLQDPAVTPEAVEQFYRDRIKDFDSKIFRDTLEYKKSFLIDYYKRLVAQLSAAQSPDAIMWQEIVSSAEQDRWSDVNEKIQTFERAMLSGHTAPGASAAVPQPL